MCVCVCMYMYMYIYLSIHTYINIANSLTITAPIHMEWRGLALWRRTPLTRVEGSKSYKLTTPRLIVVGGLS